MIYKSTDDTALAAYLHIKGVKLLHGTIRTDNAKRRAFVFEDFDGLLNLVDSFYNRTELVAPLDFQEARAAITKYLKVDLSSKIKIKMKE